MAPEIADPTPSTSVLIVSCGLGLRQSLGMSMELRKVTAAQLCGSLAGRRREILIDHACPVEWPLQGPTAADLLYIEALGLVVVLMLDAAGA